MVQGEELQCLCGALLSMGIATGECVRLESFAENEHDEDSVASHENVEFTVIKIVKVLKKTWNEEFYKAIEIHLEEKSHCFHKCT
jgi:hypothetical protein